MQPLEKGRYRVRLGTGDADLARAQALRHLCFHGRPGRDADAFDPRCDHLLIEEGEVLRGCCRLALLPRAAAMTEGYSAQFYDLRRLAAHPGPVLEIGRFCLAPGAPDADLLRLAWGGLARLVETRGVTLLFGCTSFAGADPAPHLPGLACLAGRIAPPAWRPGRKAPETVDLAGITAAPAIAALPPLLRSYLGMGGWVSDHAVIDRGLDTLHVFTALEVARIPPARVAALRMIAKA